MRGEAIKKFKAIITNNYSFDLSGCSCVELFARDGSWQTQYILNEARYSEAWEVDVSFADALRNNLPKSTIVIADSIERSAVIKMNFDIILADNPQGTYGPNNIYCEHFDVIENVHNLFETRTWLVFNINHNPFSFKQSSLWGERRSLFYGINDTSKLTKDFLSGHYENLFAKMSLKVNNLFFLDRNSEYLSYCCVELEKRR